MGRRVAWFWMVGLLLGAFASGCETLDELDNLSEQFENGGPVELDREFVDLAAGGRHLCGLEISGDLVCRSASTEVWRRPRVDLPPSGSTTLEAGGNHTCALSDAGEVTCWKAGTDRARTPFEGAGAVDALAVGGGTGTVACGVVSGSSISCRTLEDGEPISYEFEELTGRQYAGIDVASAPPQTDAAVACALLSDGQIRCRAPESAGTEPTNRAESMTPEGETQTEPFVDLTVGNEHACAVDNSGSVRCTGANTFGQTEIPTLEFDVAAVRAGAHFTCGSSAEGRTSCWGRDAAGQVSNVPEGLLDPLRVGQTFACGITGSGTTVCWGDTEWLAGDSGPGGGYDVGPPGDAGPPSDAGDTGVPPLDSSDTEDTTDGGVSRDPTLDPWRVQLEGEGDHYVSAMAAVADGSSYLVGHYRQTLEGRTAASGGSGFIGEVTPSGDVGKVAHPDVDGGLVDLTAVNPGPNVGVNPGPNVGVNPGPNVAIGSEPVVWIAGTVAADGRMEGFVAAYDPTNDTEWPKNYSEWPTEAKQRLGGDGTDVQVYDVTDPVESDVGFAMYAAGLARDVREETAWVPSLWKLKIQDGELVSTERIGNIGGDLEAPARIMPGEDAPFVVEPSTVDIWATGDGDGGVYTAFTQGGEGAAESTIARFRSGASGVERAWQHTLGAEGAEPPNVMVNDVAVGGPNEGAVGRAEAYAGPYLIVAGAADAALGDATHEGATDAVVALYDSAGNRRSVAMSGTAEADAAAGLFATTAVEAGTTRLSVVTSSNTDVDVGGGVEGPKLFALPLVGSDSGMQLGDLNGDNYIEPLSGGTNLGDLNGDNYLDPAGGFVALGDLNGDNHLGDLNGDNYFGVEVDGGAQLGDLNGDNYLESISGDGPVTPNRILGVPNLQSAFGEAELTPLEELTEGRSHIRTATVGGPLGATTGAAMGLPIRTVNFADWLAGDQIASWKAASYQTMQYTPDDARALGAVSVDPDSKAGVSSSLGGADYTIGGLVQPQASEKAIESGEHAVGTMLEIADASDPDEQDSSLVFTWGIAPENEDNTGLAIARLTTEEYPSSLTLGNLRKLASAGKARILAENVGSDMGWEPGETYEMAVSVHTDSGGGRAVSARITGPSAAGSVKADRHGPLRIRIPADGPYARLDGIDEATSGPSLMPDKHGPQRIGKLALYAESTQPARFGYWSTRVAGMGDIPRLSGQ